MSTPLVMLMQTGVPALIVGGCAAQLYGYGRFTKDFDCVVATGDSERMSAALSALGFDLLEQNHLVARYRHREQRLWILDTIFVSAETFARMWVLKRDIRAGNAILTVAAPLTVSAMKLHALKQNPSRLHDLLDIIEMLRHDRGNWSMDDVKSICEKYGPRDVFDTLKPHLE
jgi:hypothetical protein